MACLVSDCRRLRYGKAKSGVARSGVRSRAGLTVIAIELPNARRLALSVVLGQAAVTVVCALVCLGVVDTRAAVSALLGGGISVVASLVMALLSFGRKPPTDAQRVLVALLAGEAAKIVVVIALFIVVFKTMKVTPVAMLGAYMSTFIVFWVALAKALPGAGARSAPNGDLRA
jgi:ATP synthase protein I